MALNVDKIKKSAVQSGLSTTGTLTDVKKGQVINFAFPGVDDTTNKKILDYLQKLDPKMDEAEKIAKLRETFFPVATDAQVKEYLTNYNQALTLQNSDNNTPAIATGKAADEEQDNRDITTLYRDAYEAHLDKGYTGDYDSYVKNLTKRIENDENLTDTEKKIKKLKNKPLLNLDSGLLHSSDSPEKILDNCITEYLTRTDATFQNMDSSKKAKYVKNIRGKLVKQLGFKVTRENLLKIYNRLETLYCSGKTIDEISNMNPQELTATLKDPKAIKQQLSKTLDAIFHCDRNSDSWRLKTVEDKFDILTDRICSLVDPEYKQKLTNLENIAKTKGTKSKEYKDALNEFKAYKDQNKNKILSEKSIETLKQFGIDLSSIEKPEERLEKLEGEIKCTIRICDTTKTPIEDFLTNPEARLEAIHKYRDIYDSFHDVESGGPQKVNNGLESLKARTELQDELKANNTNFEDTQAIIDWASRHSEELTEDEKFYIDSLKTSKLDPVIEGSYDVTCNIKLHAMGIDVNNPKDLERCLQLYNDGELELKDTEVDYMMSVVTRAKLLKANGVKPTKENTQPKKTSLSIEAKDNVLTTEQYCKKKLEGATTEEERYKAIRDLVTKCKTKEEWDALRKVTAETYGKDWLNNHKDYFNAKTKEEAVTRSADALDTGDGNHASHTVRDLKEQGYEEVSETTTTMVSQGRTNIQGSKERNNYDVGIKDDKNLREVYHRGRHSEGSTLTLEQLEEEDRLFDQDERVSDSDRAVYAQTSYKYGSAEYQLSQANSPETHSAAYTEGIAAASKQYTDPSIQDEFNQRFQTSLQNSNYTAEEKQNITTALTTGQITETTRSQTTPTARTLPNQESSSEAQSDSQTQAQAADGQSVQGQQGSATPSQTSASQPTVTATEASKSSQQSRFSTSQTGASSFAGTSTPAVRSSAYISTPSVSSSGASSSVSSADTASVEQGTTQALSAKKDAVLSQNKSQTSTLPTSVVEVLDIVFGNGAITDNENGEISASGIRSAEQKLKTMLNGNNIINIYSHVVKKYGSRGENKLIEMIAKYGKIDALTNLIKATDTGVLLKIFNKANSDIQTILATRFSSKIYELVKSNQIDFKSLDSNVQYSFLSKNISSLTADEFKNYIQSITDISAISLLVDLWNQMHPTNRAILNSNTGILFASEISDEDKAKEIEEVAAAERAAEEKDEQEAAELEATLPTEPTVPTQPVQANTPAPETLVAQAVDEKKSEAAAEKTPDKEPADKPKGIEVGNGVVIGNDGVARKQRTTFGAISDNEYLSYEEVNQNNDYLDLDFEDDMPLMDRYTSAPSKHSGYQSALYAFSTDGEAKRGSTKTNKELERMRTRGFYIG